MDGGARNAIEKSVWLLGEDGVTIMAGSGLFSSTKGRVRSREHVQIGFHANPREKHLPRGAGMRV